MSVRQSLASSTAARSSWPECCSSFFSSRSNSVNASAVARALDPYEDDPEKIARRAMQVAAEVCVFTNDRVTVEVI